MLLKNALEFIVIVFSVGFLCGFAVAISGGGFV